MGKNAGKNKVKRHMKSLLELAAEHSKNQELKSWQLHIKPNFPQKGKPGKKAAQVIRYRPQCMFSVHR